jgi:hypothetical protein
VAAEGGVGFVGAGGVGAGAAALLFGGLENIWAGLRFGSSTCLASTLTGDAVAKERSCAARARVNVCFMFGMRD